jgi:hypothetical protein
MLLVLSATVIQLAVASLASNLSQFAGKGLAARLVLYPLLMLLVPGRVVDNAPPATDADPYPLGGIHPGDGPFLVDVTGNTLNL